MQIPPGSASPSSRAAMLTRILRFKVACRDEKKPVGDGFHERTVVDNDRFKARLARKSSKTAAPYP
jgi:fluoroacetyl-CoA thioesterase